MEVEVLWKQPIGVDGAGKVSLRPYLQQTALEESAGRWTQDMWFLSKSLMQVELAMES